MRAIRKELTSFGQTAITFSVMIALVVGLTALFERAGVPGYAPVGISITAALFAGVVAEFGALRLVRAGKEVRHTVLELLPELPYRLEYAIYIAVFIPLASLLVVVYAVKSLVRTVKTVVVVMRSRVG